MSEKSRNNNDDDLLTGAFNVMFNHINKKMQNSLPVKVTKVSSDRKFVNVQPQILVVDSDGGTILRSEIKGIPVVTSGAGNFLISFNILVGDLGWIESSDRDISLFKQSYDQSKPNTKRMHNFSDSRFIPDIMTNFTINAEDSDSMVIQNRDGSVKISLNSSRIKMHSPSDIEINGAKITPSGDVVTASGVSLNNHPHNQSNDSGGNTEQPTDAPTATE
tara:strand:- start:2180 stop:2836 length:657 start_codon:yes stop_codon:yes gene_type:complete